MGYEIIYGKQFIKLSNDKFIPMLYAGSSNCYEPTTNGRMRRERSWNNYRLDKLIVGSLSQMLEHTESIIKSYEARYFDEVENVRKNIGYYMCWSLNGRSGCNGSSKQLTSLFVDGCKKALSVEALLENNISVRVFTSYYCKEKLAELGLEPMSKYPTTTSELELLLEEWETLFAGTGVGYYVTLDGSEHRFKTLRGRFINKVKRDKKPTLVDTYYVLQGISDNRIYHTTNHYGRKPMLTYYEESAKRFYSKRQAEAKIKSLNARYVTQFNVVEVKLKEAIEILK